MLEETGYEPLSLEAIGEAGQYVVDAATGECWNKRCSFFFVRVAARTHDPVEHDHVTAWTPTHVAAALLHEEASAWAVQRVVHRMSDP